MASQAIGKPSETPRALRRAAPCRAYDSGSLRWSPTSSGRPNTMHFNRLAAGLSAATLLAASGAAFAAKTLVFCSEGSPEGFNPQFFSTGTTMDASAVPMYNRLVEFETGTTTIVPALAESWDVSADGLSYTFKLRKGVKFHSSAKFKPTRDF